MCSSVMFLNRAVTPYLNSVIYSPLSKFCLLSSFRFTDDIIYCLLFKHEKIMLSFPDLTCQCNMFLREEYSFPLHFVVFFRMSVVVAFCNSQEGEVSFYCNCSIFKFMI